MRPAESRVAVDTAVLMGDVEDAAQEPQRRGLRPRADCQAVNERLDGGPGDLVDGHVPELGRDPEFPVLRVAAPGLRRYGGLLGIGELGPDPVERCAAQARVESACSQRGFVVALGLEGFRLAQRGEGGRCLDPAGQGLRIADQVAHLIARFAGGIEAFTDAAGSVAGHQRRTCLSQERTSAQSQRRTRAERV